ncbi:MAG: DUF1460 domain-containing protein [Verrucomicrobiota bacterium]|nr:DUF1460 domain-containing protein [Verrucomicrobiota bacterium]
MRSRLFVFIFAVVLAVSASAASLPFNTVFRGRARFDRLVSQARANNWSALPIGERVAAVGQAMIGTRYKGFTLEIDDHVEAPSANFDGVDCWTFFELSLAFARMIEEPQENWTPERLLHYIELDRYRGGECTGDYLSRLHYLEDWLCDNDRRGLVQDLTRTLGGVRVSHDAREMTVGWRHYRYLVHNPSLRTRIANMEANVSSRPLYQIPKSHVPAIESQLRSGDIIGIISRDGPRGVATSHVGLALRKADGIYFMHASAPFNYGRVIVEARLYDYLNKYRSHTGILVARPLR